MIIKIDYSKESKMGELNLESEEKCGFYVSEQRKKVWQKELEILEKI